VRVAVPAFVNRRVVEPEIGSEVDEGNALVEDRGGEPLAVPVGKRGEDEVDAIERRFIEFVDDRVGKRRRKVRVDRAELLPCLALAEQLRGREFRVRGEKAQQLAADVARGSKDGRPNQESRAYLRICIFMQVNA
jgi:hypothetical protein